MSNSDEQPYPTLSRMGVTATKQIANYYITSMNLVDVLRINYDRPKDSCLPSSRTYKFPRVPECPPDEQPSSRLKMHPTLLDAVGELKDILGRKSRKETLAEEILDEIEQLEEDIAIRVERLRVLTAQIPAAR